MVPEKRGCVSVTLHQNGRTKRKLPMFSGFLEEWSMHLQPLIGSVIGGMAFRVGPNLNYRRPNYVLHSLRL